MASRMPPGYESPSRKRKRHCAQEPDKWWHLYSQHPLTFARTIRVIDILPVDLHSCADPHNEQIRATMRTFDIPELHMQSRPQLTRPMLHYQCLSYAWSGLQQDEIINVDGYKVPVTSALHTALKRLRYQSQLVGGRVWPKFWIDAICINQMDSRDKGHQIPLMGDIYACCEQLIIWLNDSTEQQSLAFEHELPAIREPALKELLQAPWFRRRWVLQEVIRAGHQQRYVLIGYHLRHLDRFIQTVCDGNEALVQASAPLLLDDRLKSAHLGRPYPLLDNLANYRHYRCRDDVDRVYSLLGISSDAGNFTFDYDQPAGWLYRDLAKHWLGDEISRLSCLVYATTTENSEERGTASWIPDWSRPKGALSTSHQRCVAAQNFVNASRLSDQGCIDARLPSEHYGVAVLRGWLLIQNAHSYTILPEPQYQRPEASISSLQRPPMRELPTRHNEMLRRGPGSVPTGMRKRANMIFEDPELLATKPTRQVSDDSSGLPGTQHQPTVWLVLMNGSSSTAPSNVANVVFSVEESKVLDGVGVTYCLQTCLETPDSILDMASTLGDSYEIALT